MSYNLFDPEDRYSDYDDEYDDEYDDDEYDAYVGPYYDGAYPCPDVSLKNLIAKWVQHIKTKLYIWRHKDEISDIPF